MDMETLFTVCNFAPIPLWLLLVFAPGWKGTGIIVHSLAIPLVLPVVHFVLMAQALPDTAGDFNSPPRRR